MDTSVYKKLDYSVALASTAHDGKQFGCIVNSLHQVTSARPAKFTVSLNKSGATTAAILESGILCITLLASDCDEAIINEFGYKSGRAIDKFSKFPFETDAQGCPYLKEGMIARISLKVLQVIEIDSYRLLVCEATDAATLANGEVLTVKALENRGKNVPPAAPVYLEGSTFRCTVCGYTRTAVELDPDFRCPICGAPVSKFEKL